MGYKIYAPNENHNCDYGVDFINGVGFTGEVAVANLLVARGYTKVEATALSEFDKLPTSTLIALANEFEVTIEENATKAEIVLALITAFTPEGGGA